MGMTPHLAWIVLLYLRLAVVVLLETRRTRIRFRRRTTRRHRPPLPLVVNILSFKDSFRHHQASFAPSMQSIPLILVDRPRLGPQIGDVLFSLTLLPATRRTPSMESDLQRILCFGNSDASDRKKSAICNKLMSNMVVPLLLPPRA